MSKKMEVIKVITKHLPAYCGDCKLINYERKVCMPTGRDVINNLLDEAGHGITKRPSFCPLIEPNYFEFLTSEEEMEAIKNDGELCIIYHWKEKESEE